MQEPIPPGRLRLAAHRWDDVVTVTVAGELDVATAGQLRAYAEEALQSDIRELVLDLAGVSFIAAAGLGVLVALSASAARRDAKLCLGEVSPAVERLLRITGMDGRFPLAPPDVSLPSGHVNSAGSGDRRAVDPGEGTRAW